MAPIFITGIGTNVGKTIASVIIVNALDAHYWKPVQAGLPGDSEIVAKLAGVEIVPEAYRLRLAEDWSIAMPLQRDQVHQCGTPPYPATQDASHTARAWRVAATSCTRTI